VAGSVAIHSAEHDAIDGGSIVDVDRCGASTQRSRSVMSVSVSKNSSVKLKKAVVVVLSPITVAIIGIPALTVLVGM